MNPYQGLKPLYNDYPEWMTNATKPLNPYQGLKPTQAKFRFRCVGGDKTLESLPGIETHPGGTGKTFFS